MPAIDHSGTRIAWREAGLRRDGRAAPCIGEFEWPMALAHGDPGRRLPRRGARSHGYGDRALVRRGILYPCRRSGARGVGHSRGAGPVHHRRPFLWRRGCPALGLAAARKRCGASMLIEPVAFHLLCEQTPHRGEPPAFARGEKCRLAGIAKATANGDYRGAMAQFRRLLERHGRLEAARSDAAGRPRPADAQDRSRFLGGDDGGRRRRADYTGSSRADADPARICSPAPARRIAEIIAGNLPRSPAADHRGRRPHAAPDPPPMPSIGRSSSISPAAVAGRRPAAA